MSASLNFDIRPSFLGRDAKQLFIDGTWSPAIEGGTFESVNPSTGQVIAQVAEGGAADVDRAVAAARAAFEGPWSRFTPIQRQNVLLQLADLIVADFDNVGLIDVLDMGMPISIMGGPDFMVEILRYYAGWATKLHGETVPNSTWIWSSLYAPGASRCRGFPLFLNSPLLMSVLKIAGALATVMIVSSQFEQAYVSPL